MANQITDNRTNIDSAESATPYDDLGGTGAGTLDNEIFIEGSNSMGLFSTNSVTGLLYDNGTVNTAYANKVIYVWINCGIVGLLDTKANGGFRIRFAGNTVTDFFEVYVGGNDAWPTAISGGWVQFAIDIEDAHTNSDNTGGTKPATNAIRYIGFASLCTVMPRMADNTWIDEIAMLDNSGATPGIIVEGRNGGSSDWTSADIYAQLGDAVGTFTPSAGGAWKVNTPVQFGINDSSTHGFADDNATWLWDEQEFVTDGFYGVSALGNSGGTTNVQFGQKTGTGDDATGAQGGAIQSAAAGPRWFMDFNDPDLDAINFYGASFIHGEDFLLDDPAVSVISCLYIDCNSALVSNSEQLRVQVVNANTADSVPFMTTDDLGDIVFGSFQFSDGHAVELVTPRVATQASKGNVFTGYGITTSNDAAVFNDSAGAVTINVTDGGTGITYKDGTSASTNVVLNPVALLLDASDTADASPVQNARAYMRAADGTGDLHFEDSITLTASGATATGTLTAHTFEVNEWILVSGAVEAAYNGLHQIVTTPSANTFTYTMGSSPSSPATGTIIGTHVMINALTDVNGEVTVSKSLSFDQPMTGWVRKSTNSPLYKQTPITVTWDKDSGTFVPVPLVTDEG